MDRLSQLRGGASGSRDVSLDGSAAGDSFLTASDSPSKYFSLSEDDSFDLSKDVTLSAPPQHLDDDCLISNLSPIGQKDVLGYKIGKQIEAANILSGGVDIFDDNENSYDGNELVIDDNVEIDDKSPSLKSPSLEPFHKSDELGESTMMEDEGGSKETEVVLQIDGKNVDAINIGNGLYLYRKEGQEELAAVQIIDDNQQQPSFKFLKVRENAEGNLEVYEEIEIEVPKEAPIKEGKPVQQRTSHVPIKGISKVISDPGSSKVVEKKINSPQKVTPVATPKKPEAETSKEALLTESVTELNLNGKMVKISESRKSPLISYHSTPNKEGIPLTKTMVDQQLHPSRHSDNIKKTIEVHTDSIKQRILETPTKSKDMTNPEKSSDKPLEEDKLINKESIVDKVDTNTTVEKVNVVAENKSNEVMDITNTDIASNKKDDVIKSPVAVTQHLASSESASMKETKLHLENKELAKDVQNKIIIPKTGDVVDKKGLETINKINKFDVTTSNPINKSEKGEDVTVKDILVDFEATDAKISENLEAKDKEVHTAEIIESEEMEIDENVLIIEEDAINVQPEIHTENYVQQASSSSETKIQTAEDQMKNLQSKEEKEGSAKISSSIELNEKKIGRTVKNIEVEKSISTTNVKRYISHDVVDNSMKKFESTLEIASKSENKTDNAQIKDTLKTMDKVKIPEIRRDVVDSVNVQINKDALKKMDKAEKLESKRDIAGPGNSQQKDTSKDMEKTEIPESRQVVAESANTQLNDSSKNTDKTGIRTDLPGSGRDISDLVEIKRDIVDPGIAQIREALKKDKPEILESKRDVAESVTQVKNTLIKIDKGQISESRSDVAEPTNKQVKETLKKLERVEIKSKQENKPDKLDSRSKATTDIKFSTVNSEVPEVKVKDSVNTAYKQETITSKVENTPQIIHNSAKNDISVNNVKTSTLLPNKEQQINLPKNIQHIAKASVVKSDVKLTVPPETKIVVNHSSEPPKTSIVDTKPKSINNNHAPVPFGKWTEANRQDFLNKIKESKAPVNSSNANQLKQANDLNRRDVLKKIDSQRQTYNVKVQESLQKSNVKTETAFSSKTVTKQESIAAEKSEAPLVVKPKPIVIKKPVQETIPKVQAEPTATVSSATKQEPRVKEINNQDLIDRTVEGIINRAVTGKEDVQTENPTADKSDKVEEDVKSPPTLLDAIEIKMNELHGIPFVERPPHELPRPPAPTETASPPKPTKIPNLLPLTKAQQKLKDCEEAIMKQEPGQETTINLTTSKTTKPEASANDDKKDKMITEKEFDKFARRNSVTYENCLTVTDNQQLIQSVVPKKISRNEQMLAEAKAKSPHKHQVVRQYQPSKGSSKYAAAVDAQKQYSKVHMAYQTALTAKRRIDSPITILEDKPVKVVYLEPSTEFTHLNVQGRDLSPAKRAPEPDTLTVGTCDSLDSDILDAIEDVKAQEETKTKRHQRKQVLTPVDTPDLELIEPGDLGIEVSPKKKRKIEPEKSLKNLVPKKSYLLGRAPRSETVSEQPVLHKETAPPNPIPVHNDAVSAIDNLVKAAELLENQSEIISANVSVQDVDSAQSTPVKRGRGRPRKNPLPDGSPVVKAPSPQKKARLEARPISSSEDSSDDEALIKENWTMGKINENIVCPICSKLFRSENVVFKHVKHCAGPSPNRSDSDKRSPRRRASPDPSPARTTPRKRKSKDSSKSTSSDEVVPIEPKEIDKEQTKKEPQKPEKPKQKMLPKTSNLVCEICGKSFRQLSYLVSHKLQHKKDETKRAATEAQSDKSIFSCETCKKEFRKLHHLVQHRLIHNPAPSRTLRKSSSEQKEIPRGSEAKAEDASAGFRCEPCDKSFRKLHHLVEHRETHDGINRQRSNSVTQVNPEKPTPTPQCEICKKTFRKLHHLIEHKEQHVETSSEKSDDQKSVKSSLSTKDIIHECNLCYMVFPNEHSLTKHTVICLRKKRQSAAKKAAQENEKNDEDNDASKPEESKVAEQEEIIEAAPLIQANVVEEKAETLPEQVPAPPTKMEAPEVKENPPKTEKEKAVKSERRSIETKATPVKATPVKATPVKATPVKATPVKATPVKATPVKATPVIANPVKAIPVKKTTPAPEIPPPKATQANKVEAPPKITHVDEIIVIEDTPKKKAPVKEKLTPSTTKRQKVAAPAAEERTAPSSDDDEIRYMFNPDFKIDETAEGKDFMKVRAKKRSSLQIERPNSKDLPRRRSLLQHPPKIPRLRAKSDDTKAAPNLPKVAVKPKLEKIEQVPSTDSDDSDVKYSFPKSAPERAGGVRQEAADKEKIRRKTMAEKRKSLGGIAKRKSMGKGAKPTPEPAKAVKRRTIAPEHRCDCGQLFSSAALLSRHASLAHTPPRRARPAPAPRAPRTRVHGGVPVPDKRASRK